MYWSGSYTWLHVRDSPIHSTDAAAESRGLGLGLLAVALFALTLPMTRLAVGPEQAPQLPPLFVTAGRASLAALLSIAFLRLTGAPRPPRRLWPVLLLCAAGTVIGFPLFLALALRQVDAMHAAVVTGLLPLATAAIAALVFRQRPSAGFWACALLGCALVLGFAAQAGGGCADDRRSAGCCWPCCAHRAVTWPVRWPRAP